MPLPPGFELESSSNSSVKLPPGFQLESPTREELIAAIPGASAKPRVNEIPQSRGVMDYVLGAAETPIAVGQSLLSIPLGAASYGIKKLTGGQPNIDTEMGRFAYRPSTQTAQQNLQTLSDVFEASKLPPMPGVTGGLATQGLNRLAGPALRQAANLPATQSAVEAVAQSRPVQAVNRLLEERAATKQAARVAKSYEQGPKLDAAQDASKYGISLNPNESNPTIKSRVLNAVVGDKDTDAVLSRDNLPKWNRIAREDTGIPSTQPLNAETFEKAHANPKLTEAYDAVRSIQNMAADESVINNIQNLRRERLIGASPNAAAEVNAMVDRALEDVSSAPSGAKVLDSIQSLRQQARATRDAQMKGIAPPSPEQMAVAEAKSALADQLETMIDNNASPKVLNAYKAARKEHAKLYDWESATDLATGQVDPAFFRKMINEKRPLSERQTAVGRIAANFPDIAKIESIPNVTPRLARTGIGGGLGASIGYTMGGYPGAIAGGAIGALAGESARLASLNRMRNPSFQLANAIPPDYRAPIVNQLIPPRSPTGNLPAIYDPAANLNQGEPSYQPNWTYGQPQVNPNIRPEMPSGPAQLPSPEQAMQFVQQARDYQYGAEARAAGRQQAAEEAAAAASRRPASGEVLLDFDPITGRLRPVSRGLPGATPETITSTGHNLESASEKVAANKLFDLTAAEKVAWEKTKVDLAKVDPGLKGLSDKAIAERMMDRDWVADAVKKAREKEALFADLAQRANTKKQQLEAARAREEMMQYAEDLEEHFRTLRSSPKSGQGPKTREAIRNQLLGGSRNINSLNQ